MPSISLKAPLSKSPLVCQDHNTVEVGRMGYLVIGLKVGQRIAIGEIEILISDYDNGRVDVAIKAPKHIKINRIPTHAQQEFGKAAQDENRNLK